MPRRYEDMSREDRIEAADKAAVMELEKELRRGIKKKYAVDIPKKGLKDIIEEWVKKQKWRREVP